MTRRDLGDVAIVTALFGVGVIIDVALTLLGLEVLEAFGLWPIVGHEGR